jgi:hypothetical protein
MLAGHWRPEHKEGSFNVTLKHADQRNRIRVQV